MELVRPGSSESIDHLLALSVEALPTYPEVGATLKGEQPRGYRHDQYEAKLGIGRRTFLRATTGLQTWRSHKVPGIGVLPHATPIELGATVVVIPSKARSRSWSRSTVTKWSSSGLRRSLGPASGSPDWLDRSGLPSRGPEPTAT